MKHKSLIAGAATGIAAGLGAAAFLLGSKKGREIRESLVKNHKEESKKLVKKQTEEKKKITGEEFDKIEDRKTKQTAGKQK